VSKRKCLEISRYLVVVLCLVVILSACDTGIAYKPDMALQEYTPDEKTLEILLKEERACFDFFWNTANTDKDSPGYGLIPDRMPTGPDVSSIASVGFGLTGICIGVERGWITREQGAERVKGTLETLYNNVQQDHGFFYHFLDIKTGQRVWDCEVSIIDTALCLNGVIMAGEYFGGEIAELAEKIYARVDWPWYTDRWGNGRYYMGYKPETGFFGSWNMTAEQLMMYFLGTASPEKPVDPGMFYIFSRPEESYGGLPKMIHSPAGSIFVYQYSHAWYDFRNTRDAYGTDWFRNSIIASLSSRQYAIDNEELYNTGELDWGFSACDGPEGYSGEYGSQPAFGNRNDGTIPPYGAAGSIVFTPENSARSIVNMYEQYPELWGEWGFKDAYNKTMEPMWIAKDVIGIDKGITMLMIENYLTGMVWEYMSKNKYVQSGMKRCGIHPANTYGVESFENNPELGGITGQDCTFRIQTEETHTGVNALEVNTKKGGKLRFKIDSRLLNDENNSMLQYAVKGKVKATVRYLDGSGKEIKAVSSPSGSEEWRVVQVPAAKELKSDIGNISFVELEFKNDGIFYIDDVEFINDDPRIYNVILDGSRKAGSVLKPVWNTWDKKGRKVYIDEIRWYISDTPLGDWKQIEGADRLTYTIKNEDVGKYIKCELYGVIPEGIKLIRLDPAQSDVTGI
jgi:hypothetical protein